MSKPVIEERENGPLVIKGLTSMTDADGNAVEVKPVMALCRCGASKSKPFCDGSHNEIGFQSRGGEASGKDILLSYQGDEVTVMYNPRVCSHAAHCATRLPEVFDPKSKPWCNPNGASGDRVREIVQSCPSGALSLAEEGHLLPEGRAEITVEKNGPYWALGVDVDVPKAGEGATADKKVLCRCGLSGNKPYCDGSHYNEGWKDE